MKCLLLLLAAAAAGSALGVQVPRLATSEDLIGSVISDCFNDDNPTGCLKVKVLGFLDTKLGVASESARALDEANIDRVIFERVGRVIGTNEFRWQLPEFLFQSAEVSYRADRGFDVDIPERDDGNGEARGLLKKKLLLPILLLFKLKMKALMPLLVTVVGVKAVKALILSKLAITLVLGFLVYNLVMKKGGMPMMMPTEAPAAQYGPPAAQYGGPASTPAAPADSYSPQWEPSASGPYARVWDPAQLAYSSYYPAEAAGSSQAPSYSSVASISTASASSSSP